MKNWSRNAQKFFGQEHCSNYSPIYLLQRGSVNVFLDSVFFVVTVKGQLVDSFGRHCIQATPQQQCFFCNFSCTCFFRPCFLLKYTRFCASVQLALKVETSCGKFLWAINTITCTRVLFFPFWKLHLRNAQEPQRAIPRGDKCDYFQWRPFLQIWIATSRKLSRIAN